MCAAECEEYQFTVPHDVVGRATPFLAAIKNTVAGPGGTFDANDGFDLYVYGPSGKLVASQNGIGANGQSAMVTPTGAGVYTAVVTVTYAEDSGAGWNGEIRLITPTTWQPALATCGLTVSGVTDCFELPTLRSLPPYDVTASGLRPVPSTPLGFRFPASVPTSNSCHADESLGLDNPSAGGVQHPVTRCLRFTSDVENTGAGSLTVRIPLAGTGASGQPDVAYLPGRCSPFQILTTSTGQTVSRPAGQCEFHAEHGHFHYAALVGYASTRPTRMVRSVASLRSRRRSRSASPTTTTSASAPPGRTVPEQTWASPAAMCLVKSLPPRRRPAAARTSKKA